MIQLLTHFILLIRIRIGESLGYRSKDGMLVLAAIVGVLGGAASALFREANIGLKWLLTGSTDDIVAIAENLSPEMRLLIPTLGGVLGGIMLVLGSRLFKGMRSQEYLEVIRLGDGVISIRPTLARLLSSLFAISSGASIGREGGMVQLVALVSSSVGRFFNLSRPKLRLLVACGGAAGMASAYNTPLAGALFIAEVVLQSLAIEAFGPLLVASVMATLTIRHWIGINPIFTLPSFTAPLEFEFFPVLGLGILSGFISPLFLKILDLTKQAFQYLRLPLPISLGLGGFIVGVISVYKPEVWGNGHALVELLLSEHPEAGFVLSLLLLKIVATSAAVGSGAVGGVFTPTLLIGAAVGWLYSNQLHALLPLDTVTYTALGMGAILSGTSHAPLMAILMIFEMTMDANLLFPLIVVTITARYISAAIRPQSIYARALGEINTKLPYLMLVSELQVPTKAVVNEDVTAETVSEMFCLSPIQNIWVVDKSGCYQGCISLQNMKSFLGDDTLQHLSASVVFMEDDVPTVNSDAALTDVLVAFAKTTADRLPVVDGNRMLMGEISKTDILLTLS
ncbi:MAG: ClcB-like voltage-gated chloride channel protein [Methylococcales bacterium]